MRRIAKLAVVGAMTAALVGGSASAALAGDYDRHGKKDRNGRDGRVEVTQCVSQQSARGSGLLGVGVNVNVLNSSSCSGSVIINR